MSNTKSLFKIGDIVLEQKNPYLKLKIKKIEHKNFHCSVLEEKDHEEKIFKEDELMLDDSIAIQ
jgi:hypothetical protein